MPPRPTPLFHVDAFTDRAFAGNPAAVCVLDEPRPDAWMQGLAREMNLSETAFVAREADAFSLRWFTPTVEVDLCGHATLATAHVLWETGLLAAAAPGHFATKSGVLVARRRSDGVELDFPARPVQETEAPPGLEAALGARPIRVARNADALLAEFATVDEVRGLRPDFAAMRALPAWAIMVTAPGGATEHDFVSRFFAPAKGVDEDPVTGSAHCSLGPYWSARLGKTELSAFQVSARGGRLRVRVAGDRVFLVGRAVTVARGELLV